MSSLILASTSESRAKLLRNAGLIFRTHSPDVDERALEKSKESENLEPNEIALLLAEAKAAGVSSKFENDLVIGADQVLSLDGRLFYKPPDIAAAHDQLMQFSGKCHFLHSAIACAQGGRPVWSNISSAKLCMRKLSPSFIDRYLDEIGESALKSVGCYQLESQGIQLFEKIEGDFFTILGVPMVPLLSYLREKGFIES